MEEENTSIETLQPSIVLKEFRRVLTDKYQVTIVKFIHPSFQKKHANQLCCPQTYLCIISQQRIYSVEL